MTDIEWIGNHSSGQPFAQTIDEFAVFDSALSAEDVAVLAGAAQTATVTIEIQGQNDPFSDGDDTLRTDEGAAVTGGILSAVPPANPGGVTSGLALWLDATDINGDGQPDSLNNGDAITSWQDRSGNGHNADVVLGSPFYVANSTETASNLPAVGFSTAGGNDRLNTSNIPLGDNYTVFAVSRYTGGANARVVTSGSTNWLFGHWSNHTGSLWANGDNSTLFVHNDGNTDMHVYSAVLGPDINGTVGEFAGNPAVDYWKDGVQLQNDNQGIHNTNYKPGSISLGAYLTNGEGSNAEVSEVIIYDRALSDAERLMVGGLPQCKILHGSERHHSSCRGRG